MIAGPSPPAGDYAGASSNRGASSPGEVGDQEPVSEVEFGHLQKVWMTTLPFPA